MSWWSNFKKNVLGIGSSSSPSSSTSTNPNAAIASMGDVGVMSLGGKVTPGAPANAGNPAILQYNPGNPDDDDDGPSYTVVGALDPTKPPSVATNADGSIYQPTNNPVNIANTIATADLINTGYDGNMVLSDGNGGYVTIDGNEIAGPTGNILTNDGSGNFTSGGGSTVTGGGNNTTTTTTTTNGGGGGTPVTPTVNQALLDALALRDAALARQLGLLNEQFTFATDDYYNQLGTDYREGGLSEAFTTAYDDAVRGIYDVYKSAGMLAQSDVDDDLGILAGAEGGEENRIDSIVDQYMGANRNYVTGGKSDLTSELQGLAVDSQDIPTINAQTAAINAFDVVGRSQPYKEPTEAEVVDFFTDFVKRAYDPSYNVDPSAVTTGAPKRVTGSVNQKGANTAPSTIAGLFDPVTGGSVKVVN